MWSVVSGELASLSSDLLDLRPGKVYQRSEIVGELRVIVGYSDIDFAVSVLVMSTLLLREFSKCLTDFVFDTTDDSLW
jgi:hypothetical protein